MEMRIEGLKEFMADLQKAANMLPDVTREAIRKSTTHIKNKVQDKITSEGITFMGGLQGSVFAPMPTPTRGEVYVGKKYGVFVEKGTRPHWPPREPLERWAAIKLGQPGLGFVVARKIARKGTKPHPFFAPAVEQSLDAVSLIFNEIPKVLVRVMAGR